MVENENSDMSRKRAFGSVMGAFVGDASGAVLEFYNQRITEQDVDWALKMNGGGENEMGPGQITDDSEMAMCIMHGLCHEQSEEIKAASEIVIQPGEVAELNLDRIQVYFRKWVNSGPFDVGMTTRTALRAINVNRPNPSVSYKCSFDNTR